MTSEYRLSGSGHGTYYLLRILSTHFPALFFQIALRVSLISELGSHILQEEEGSLMSG